MNKPSIVAISSVNEWRKQYLIYCFVPFDCCKYRRTDGFIGKLTLQKKLNNDQETPEACFSHRNWKCCFPMKLSHDLYLARQFRRFTLKF